MGVVYEIDDERITIIGYNQGIIFQDPDRTTQAEVYLQDNDELNIGGVKIVGGGISGSSGMSAHDLSGGLHTGLLSSDQAPQFLLLDGTRSMTGDLDFGTGIGITHDDGVTSGNVLVADGTRYIPSTLLGIGTLTDPGADRIAFWDDSETSLGWLTPADEIVISTTNISIDHDACTNFVANEHIGHTSVTLTAGDGLTGGGDISASRTFAVGAGTGIAVNANDVALSHLSIESLSDPGADRIIFWDDSDTACEWLVANTGLEISGNNLNCTITQTTEEIVEDWVGGMVTGNTETLITVTYQDADGTLDFVVDEASINHDALTGFVANEHINHASVIITAGNGLTGTHDIASSFTLAVGAGDGIDVAADSIAVDVTDILGNGMAETSNNIYCYALRQSDDGAAALTANAAGDLTMAEDLIVRDGKTIGQAAGPLLAFDDSNNYLEITGCDVGIGTTTPNCKLDVAGVVMSSVAGAVGTGYQAAAFYLYTASDPGMRFIGNGPDNSTRAYIKFVTREMDGGNPIAPIEVDPSGNVLLTQSTGTLSVGGSAELGSTSADASDNAGSVAFAGGEFAASGDAQELKMVCWAVYDHNGDTAWKNLYLDGSSSYPTLPTDSAWAVAARVVGTTQLDGSSISVGFSVMGMISNDSGTTAMIGSSTTTVIDDSDDTSLDAQLVASDAADALIVQVQDSDGANQTIRWVAFVSALQVKYP